MKGENVILGARLRAIADAVRDGVFFYDVGTDHAYLPTYLLQNGRVPFATASDIVAGPLAIAAQTLRQGGVEDRVRLVLTDGLRGIELIPPCDIAIAGMGGEMIAAILDDAPQVRREGVRLLLQPMTKVCELRAYLAEHGFAFEREQIVKEGKLYSLLICRYIGAPTVLSEEELLLGARGIRVEDDLFYEYVNKLLQIYTAIADGKRRGGNDPADEERQMALLCRILEKKETLS